MNVQEGPEWEIASHLLSDLRSVLHNQALSVGDLVDKLNAFDFSLLDPNGPCIVRKSAMLWMMAMWRHLRFKFLQQVGKRLYGGTQSPNQMTSQDLRSRIRRLRDIPNPARFTDLVHVTELLSMKIQSPLVLSSARKCVYLVLKPEQLQTELKLSTKTVFSEQQVFSYFLRRSDQTYTQLGLDMSRLESIFANHSLVSTLPDPEKNPVFSTMTMQQNDIISGYIEFVSKPVHSTRTKTFDHLDSPAVPRRLLRRSSSILRVQRLRDPSFSVYCLSRLSSNEAVAGKAPQSLTECKQPQFQVKTVGKSYLERTASTYISDSPERSKAVESTRTLSLKLKGRRPTKERSPAPKASKQTARAYYPQAVDSPLQLFCMSKGQPGFRFYGPRMTTLKPEDKKTAEARGNGYSPHKVAKPGFFLLQTSPVPPTVASAHTIRSPAKDSGVTIKAESSTLSKKGFFSVVSRKQEKLKL